MGNILPTFETMQDQIESGIHPDNIMYSGYPAIFNTSTEKEIELLLREGSNINLVYSGKTPLTYAAERNLHDQARILLMYGADVNPTDSFSATKIIDGRKLSVEMHNLLSCWGFPAH